MKRVLLVFTIIAVCAIVFLPAQRASAQNVYGAIRGVISDQSGARIPDAQITLTNANTGVSEHTASSAAGSFEFLNVLAPATYRLRAERSGFQTYLSSGIQLNVNQVFVIHAVLKVGETTQEISVQATSAQIDTTTMQRGTTITGNQIVNLPLVGRNWTQLQQIEPGVVASSDRFGTYSTNGAETQQNAYLINGGDSMDAPLNTPGIIPSPDALSEFRMVTSTINPEFSRNSGAIMNVLIKNGTNQLHGDGFEFFRDKTLDARNFYQPTVSPFHQNEFGGTIGGPITIPHIYNGRDRSFFFFSYQGIRAATPQSFSVPTVFSAKERTGDFSAATGGAFPVDNPSNSNPTISPFAMPGINGTVYPAGTPYNTLFPTGVIPTADLNPLALKLMNQFVPLPNTTANGYTFNPTTTTTENQYLWRVDQSIRSKDRLWAYGFWETHPSVDTLPFTGSTLPGFAETQQEHFQQYSADWTHIVSPTTVNEARFSYFRFNFVTVYPQTPMNPTAYGFTGIIPQAGGNSPDVSLPVVSLSGLFTIGFSTNGPQPRIDQTYEGVDNFSKIFGHHTFKAGFHVESFQVFNPFNNVLDGSFTFNGAGTFSTGFPGADFLLGLPDSYAQGSGTIINARARDYYSYAQDQWQVRHNLTLTYGLGWDIETPWKNLYNGGEMAAAFRQGQSSKLFPPVFPPNDTNPADLISGAPVGVVYPGDPGINAYGGPKIPYKDFAPRAGFAWSPGSSEKWSVRGGIGLYYNRTEEELSLQTLGNQPFSLGAIGAAAVGGAPSFATPFSGWCTAKGAPPTACSTPQTFPFTAPAKGATVNFGEFEPLGFNLNVQSANFGVPMSENYSLTVERQVSPSTIFSIAYVGNSGHHLEGAYDLNPAGSAPGVNPGAVALGCNAFNLPSCDPGSFALNALVYGSPGYEVTDFDSNYNSLQVEFNKHFSNGLQLLADYTWSRYMDYSSNFENDAFNAPGINIFNLRSMYGPSANDAPQRFVLAYYYTLPIYHFIHHIRRLTDGWNLTGITTFQMGFPVNVNDSAFTSLTCDPIISFYACPDRANVTGAPQSIGNPRTYTLNGLSNYWLNPNAFAIPPAGAGVGNASRDPFYGPGINNFDIALLKDIHLTESKYIQLRLETYGTFNHTQFGAPDGNIADPNFGRIFSSTGERVVQLAGKIYF